MHHIYKKALQPEKMKRVLTYDKLFKIGKHWCRPKWLSLAFLAFRCMHLFQLTTAYAGSLIDNLIEKEEVIRWIVN